jgi:hypothetical protein
MLKKDKGIKLEVGFHKATRLQIVQCLFEGLQPVRAMTGLLLSAQLHNLHATLPNFKSETHSKLCTASALHWVGHLRAPKVKWFVRVTAVTISRN